MPSDTWTVEQQARVVAQASKLTGEPLAAHLEREGVKLPDFKRWRIALKDGSSGSGSAAKRIRQLERELARKEKALAEGAALLVLKKRSVRPFKDEDDDTGGRARAILRGTYPGSQPGLA